MGRGTRLALGAVYDPRRRLRGTEPKREGGQSSYMVVLWTPEWPFRSKPLTPAA